MYIVWYEVSVWFFEMVPTNYLVMLDKKMIEKMCGTKADSQLIYVYGMTDKDNKLQLGAASYWTITCIPRFSYYS